jgi:membrane-associated phospholipid phosphatase
VLATLLRGPYHSTGPQLVLVLVALALTRQRERLGEFLAVFAICSAATGIAMLSIPSEGAYAYYRPDLATFTNYSSLSGMWHHPTLVALRTDAAPLLNFLNSQGLVTFPSFHTALAIMTTYAVREWRPLFIVVGGINAAVIVGTITEGGHHLVDIIAGASITVASIALVQIITSRDQERGYADVGTVKPESLA